MAIYFDKLPTDKPSSAVEPGKYTGTVMKAEMVTSKAGNDNLKITFKLDEGGFVNEFYQESEIPFIQYKIGRLLEATKVKLEGEGTLKDIAKVVMNRKVQIDVGVNDRGYNVVDYSGENQGLYPVAKESEKVEETNSDIDEAITADDEY